MIVMLTALDLEGAAVRAHLSGVRVHHHAAGTVFEVGHLAGRPGCAVALAVIGMGTVNAAAITERAIAEFRPSAVLFVGVAGGLRDWTKLGDVVVATRVYAYHGGRVDNDEFLARPRAWDTSHRLVQLAKHINRSRAWPGAEHNPAAVHFEPIAAGEIVLNSATSPHSEHLRSHYNDAVAIEMESAGVALAGHLHESTPTIAIRGICDLADGTKHTTDTNGWQPIAAHNAAAFAVGLAAAIDENAPRAATASASAGTTSAPAVPEQPALAAPSVRNIHGNYVGSVVAGGSVKISQRITNYARRHPIPFTMAVVVLIALLGWGGYGVVAAVFGGDTNGASSVASTSGSGILATGNEAACGLRNDHTVVCWGTGGEYLKPPGQFSSIAVNGGVGCGLRDDKTVTCWDASSASTTTGPSPTPRSAANISSPSGQFQAITTICGVRVNGSIECWVEAPEPPAGKFTAITSGMYGGLCALREDRNVVCWGRLDDLNAPPSGPFETVAVGGYHACALRENRTLVCWGKNDEGQATAPEGEFLAVTTGEEHSCALRTNQTVVCWGRNKDGQTEPPGRAFSALGVGTGGEYSCGVRPNGAAECWGRQGRVTPPSDPLLSK